MRWDRARQEPARHEPARQHALPEPVRQQARRVTVQAGGFDEFVAARGPSLLRFAYLLTGDRHEAEDLVQEVLARTHHKWSRIEQMAAPEAYVRTCLVRQNLSWKRRLRSTETVVAEVPEGPDQIDRYGPEQQVVARGQMWRLLSALPRAQRVVLVLRFYADLSDDQIAAQVGCSASTVRAHASRALAKLRKEIGDD